MSVDARNRTGASRELFFAPEGEEVRVGVRGATEVDRGGGDYAVSVSRTTPPSVRFVSPTLSPFTHGWGFTSVT